MDGYEPHQLSTYALTLFRHQETVDGQPVTVGMFHLGAARVLHYVHTIF